MRSYTVSAGSYFFPFDNFQIRLMQVQRNRYGRIFGDVEIVTQDGKAYLAVGHGDLQSWRFHADLARQAARRNSGDTLTFENAFLDVYLAIREDPNVAEQLPAPKFQSAPDFLQGVPPPRPAVVDGLLIRGGLYSFAARPKTGKSILLLNLALAVAAGGTWLGRRVERGRALMFLLEDSPITVERRLETMCPRGMPDNLLIHADQFRLAEENYEATLDACKGAALVICDPVIQATEVKDWNSQQEVRDSFDLWRRLARDTEACIVLSYHHRKMAGDFGDALAGSVQAQATVDGILELYRNKSLQSTERKVTYIGRDWPDIEDEVVSLDIATLTWIPAGTYTEAHEAAGEVKKGIDAEAAFDVLPDHEPGFTHAEWEGASGFKSTKIDNIRKHLAERIAQSGDSKGGRGSAMRFWKA